MEYAIPKKKYERNYNYFVGWNNVNIVVNMRIVMYFLSKKEKEKKISNFLFIIFYIQ